MRTIVLFLLPLAAFAQTTYLGGSLTIEGTTNYCGSDSGSGNAYTCTNPTSAQFQAYRTGHSYSFGATHTNSGASTLAVDGLTATSIKKWSSGGLVDLASGDIQSGAPFTVTYNGTYFILTGPANSSAGGGGGGGSAPGGASGTIQFNNAGVLGGFTMSGDGTVNTGTGAFTLATVNGAPGPCGDATHSCQLMFDAKGRVTAQNNIAINATGAGTRTWLFSAQGMCQSGADNAAIWMPTSSAPTFTTCDATHQQGEWQIPATTTGTNWGLSFRVPAGATGTWTLTLTWRTTDTSGTHSLSLTPAYACVASGSNPDNPSFTTLTPFSVTPSATPSVLTDASYTFTPTCSAGSSARLLLTASSNTITSPVSLSYESVAMQAGN